MTHKELDRLYAIITLILCILFLGGIGIYSMITAKVITGIEIILTAFVTIITTIIGYLWGSSVGSKDKSDTIDKITDGKEKDCEGCQ